MKKSLGVVSVFLLGGCAALAEQPGSLLQPSWQPQLLHLPDYITGQKATLGGFSPVLNFQSIAASGSTNPANLAAGEGEPRDNGLYYGFEFGALYNYKQLTLSSMAHWQETSEDHISGHLEEYFFSYAPNDNWELRGGQFFNRFGLYNQRHQHALNWVEHNLTNSVVIGEHALTTVGAELNYSLPVWWTSVLSFSFGVVPELEEHEHEHGLLEEAAYEYAEGAYKSSLATLNWTNQQDYNDFHQVRYGVSMAIGRNLSNKPSYLGGVHAQYEWRQNGYAAGGNWLRFSNELIVRDWKAYPGEHGVEEFGVAADKLQHFSSVGYHAGLLFGWNSVIESGLRCDVLSGVAGTEQRNRVRISPNISWVVDEQRSLLVRLQYNHDLIGDFKEDLVFLQFSYSFGSGCF